MQAGRHGAYRLSGSAGGRQQGLPGWRGGEQTAGHSANTYLLQHGS